MIPLYVFELCTISPLLEAVFHRRTRYFWDHKMSIRHVSFTQTVGQSLSSHFTMFHWNEFWKTKALKVSVCFLRDSRGMSLCVAGGERAAWGMLTDCWSPFFGLAPALICSCLSQPNRVFCYRPITAQFKPREPIQTEASSCFPGNEKSNVDNNNMFKRM